MDEVVAPTPVRTRRDRDRPSARTPVLMYHSVATTAAPSFRTFVTDLLFPSAL